MIESLVKSFQMETTEMETPDYIFVKHRETVRSVIESKPKGNSERKRILMITCFRKRGRQIRLCL